MTLPLVLVVLAQLARLLQLVHWRHSLARSSGLSDAPPASEPSEVGRQVAQGAAYFSAFLRRAGTRHSAGQLGPSCRHLGPIRLNYFWLAWRPPQPASQPASRPAGQPASQPTLAENASKLSPQSADCCSLVLAAPKMQNTKRPLACHSNAPDRPLCCESDCARKNR